MGRGRTSCLVWEPLCPPRTPLTDSGRNHSVARSHPFIDRCTLIHTWTRTSLIHSAKAPPGKAKPARKPAARPAWFLVPHKAGPGLCACQKWHAGSVRVPSEQRARPSQLPLCPRAAQQDASPHTNASGIPARNAKAEGRAKKGLRNGLRPMSEQLKVPHEPVPARAPTRAGGQQRGRQGTKQPLQLQPSSAHWSWTLALLAFRDRCCKRRENIIVRQRHQT